MPIQAFVDESGGKGHSRHFVMAGLVGHSENWAAFSDEWHACLDARPSIKRFKMSEAAALQGNFYGLSHPERDVKLRDLAQIINRHAILCTYSVIDLDAHAKTWASLEKPQSEPYFWPFHNTILAVCFSLWDANWKERFEIIFDEQVIFGPRARHWYPVTRAAVKIREPKAHSIMPIDPMFKSDDDFLPLQASDMFSWCVRRNTDHPNNPSFEWLLEELPSIRMSKYSQYYDFDRMKAVQDKSLQSETAADFTPDVVALYRELYDQK